jgi:hypothetical protein
MSSADTETPGTHAADSPASGGEGAAPKVSGLIGSDVFATLLARAACTVSVYLSNTPTDHDRRGPDARLRSLIQLAEDQLERRGMELRVRDVILDPLRQFAAGTDFARHRDPCLALFTRSEGAPDGEVSDAGAPNEGASATGMTTIALPWTRPDEVIVGPDFHIKPLLPILALDRRFNILALSKSNVRLLSATPFDWTAVPLDALPIEAQAELDSRPAADTASTDEARMALIVADPRRIAIAVKTALGDDPAPIVLVADPHVAGHFAKHAQLRGLHPAVLHLNPFALTEAELHGKVVELMQPDLQSELDGVLEQVNARLGTAEPTVAIRLEEILAAAQEGRVDTVVVAEDEALWGRFEPGQRLVAHGKPGPDDEDLLNQAAVLALRNGGRAFAVPRERLPRQAPAAAILRF